MKIVFMGTPDFGAVILEGLVKKGYKPVLVITAPDKPVGRKQIITPPPVKVIAQKYKIPVEQPKRIENCKLKIVNLKPDLGIVSAYGQIIPKDILDIPKSGFINVHPSLLPKHRGPSPIQYAILNGDEETGVTIMLMDEKMDHGPILAQQELEFSIFNYQFSNLHDELAQLGAKLLVETIPKWIKGEIKPIPQDDSKATYTNILKKDDGKINWQKPAQEIERKIRAFNPWPGTFALLKIKNQKLKCKMTNQNAKLLKIIEADVLPVQVKKQVGEVFLTDDKKLAVQTGKNCLILQKLQLEGKKPISAEDFLRGHREIIGTILQ